ncbi:DMT family transporter [Pseudanabaena sp. FACHB-2040]|uniref:DMT family transporter n=1 Tax=Pseudanabaena sp. FACHB-2040 TaxID=2692859 RepID=UPI001684E00D|nr:DMT family transporter [Pseudanabaena sp. FACHB-2040]MBD2258343.1 DMT family transporter [Pseudanabaena sp. FACHB-2040]
MLGTLLVLLSTCCLAIQNVALKIIVSPQIILGQFPWGGWVEPSFQHSVLLLQLRTLFVVPMMFAISCNLYPPTFQELRQTFTLSPTDSNPRKIRYGLTVIGASVAVFAALVLLFTAISFLSTGIAVTLFFIHPALTTLLAWALLGERPKPFHLRLMGLILLGLVLTTPHPDTLPLASWIKGSLSALSAGFCFAGYSLLTQLSLRAKTLPPGQRPLHPLPFSLVLFATNLVLATVSLLWVNIQVLPEFWPAIWLVSGLSGITAMIAYILNNYGIQMIGAARTSLISSTTPILTALLAWFTLQEGITLMQLLGILLVTLGIACLSLKFHGEASA